MEPVSHGLASAAGLGVNHEPRQPSASNPSRPYINGDLATKATGAPGDSNLARPDGGAGMMYDGSGSAGVTGAPAGGVGASGGNAEGAKRPQPQPQHNHPHNPQLGPEPWFAYPTPTPSQLDEDLPPYDESEGLPLGLILDRLARRGYGDLRVLLEQTLPGASTKQRPKHIIDFAKSQRQVALKYLAILRWKRAVNMGQPGPSTVNHSAHPTTGTLHGSIPGPLGGAAASFPTPHSNGESSNTSPAADTTATDIKGKGRARPGDEEKPNVVEIRGRVTDAKRITHFMEHQNSQHELAIGHIQHVTKMIESLRERNPDLLTAISLFETGTYNRLPTSITESFLPPAPLTNRKILQTLRRLNRHILYRLKCVDYVPPELTIRSVQDGKVYVASGGPCGWRAQFTVVGFGEQSTDEGRWWLTGLEWGWRSKDERLSNDVIDAGGLFRKVTGESRQAILDVVNEDVLRPRALEEDGQTQDNPRIASGDDRGIGVGAVTGPATSVEREEEDEVVPVEGHDRKVDAPLVRLVNFIQHLSLTQQLEALYLEAVKLNQGKWRGNLVAELKREDNALILRYWIRPRTNIAQGQDRGPNRSDNSSRFICGGTLTISVTELDNNDSYGPQGGLGVMNDVLRDATSGGMIPTERILNLGLSIKWEIGESGAGGSLKAGDKLDTSHMRLDPGSLSLEDVLLTVVNSHASHLLRNHVSKLDPSRITLFPLHPPAFSTESTRLPPPSSPQADTTVSPVTVDTGLSYRIPLPSQLEASSLQVTVSPYTGLIEIADMVGREGRAMRARMATMSVNEGKSRLLDDLVRLITAIITENLENQMRQFGWMPTRRLPIRYQDLPKNDLYPASSIFVPLPTSPLHYFVAKVVPSGIAFELLRLIKTAADGGALKFAIGDRSPLDVAKLQARRQELQGKDGAGGGSGDPATFQETLSSSGSNYEMASRDLKALFIFSNALVAQTIIEQQLKDRSIPYTLQYPSTSGDGAPLSTSVVAGMIPTLCVNTRDLLKDARVADVAMPTVYIQIRDWWKSQKCQVVTVVQLRQRQSIGTTSTSSTPPTVAVQACSSSNVQSETITFDPLTSIVRFKESDISRCVPSFLEEWERLSKVLVVAGEVNRLNKSKQFKDLRMISFDLCTATLSYAPGYSCAITYTPSDDSYEVSFLAEEGENPHAMLQGLFSHKLNELSRGRDVKVSLAKAFCEALCNTLPFLLTIRDRRPQSDAQPRTDNDNENENGQPQTEGSIQPQNRRREYPKLVVKSISSYRLIWDDNDAGKRYSLDVSLLCHTPRQGYILSDGSINNNRDKSCGVITPIPNFTAIVNKVRGELVRVHADADSAAAAAVVPGPLPATVDVDRPTETAEPIEVDKDENTEDKAEKPEQAAAIAEKVDFPAVIRSEPPSKVVVDKPKEVEGCKEKEKAGKTRPSRPGLVMVLDEGKTLMCPVDTVQDALKGLIDGLEGQIGQISHPKA